MNNRIRQFYNEIDEVLNAIDVNSANFYSEQQHEKTSPDCFEGDNNLQIAVIPSISAALNVDRHEQVSKRKRDLSDAIQSKDITKLENAIEWARFDGLQAELKDDLYLASHTLKQIDDIERIRGAVRDLRQSVVSELRSYTNPPQVVQTVMLCTYLLLGVKEEKHLRRWPAIQTLLCQRGKNSLKTLIMHFERHHIVAKTAARARELLAGFDVKSVCDVSEGAAVFYLWVSGMIQEVDDDNTAS